MHSSIYHLINEAKIYYATGVPDYIPDVMSRICHDIEVKIKIPFKIQ